MTLDEIEKSVIMSRLEEFKGNRTHTARSLGIGIRTLQRKLHAYGVNPPSIRKPSRAAVFKDELDQLYVGIRALLTATLGREPTYSEYVRGSTALKHTGSFGGKKFTRVS